jgi:hypothetical protein
MLMAGLKDSDGGRFVALLFRWQNNFQWDTYLRACVEMRRARQRYDSLINDALQRGTKPRLIGALWAGMGEIIGQRVTLADGSVLIEADPYLQQWVKLSGEYHRELLEMETLCAHVAPDLFGRVQRTIYNLNPVAERAEISAEAMRCAEAVGQLCDECSKRCPPYVPAEEKPPAGAAEANGKGKTAKRKTPAVPSRFQRSMKLFKRFRKEGPPKGTKKQFTRWLADEGEKVDHLDSFWQWKRNTYLPQLRRAAVRGNSPKKAQAKHAG